MTEISEMPSPASQESGAASVETGHAAALQAALAEVAALTQRLRAADAETARHAEALRVTRLELVHHMRDHTAIMARWEQLYQMLRDQAVPPGPAGFD